MSEGTPAASKPPEKKPVEKIPLALGLPFSDHMVLQRGKPNAIWGWSQPGDAEIPAQHLVRAHRLVHEGALLLDVRETAAEYCQGHIPGAVHMSRGTIELDIEEKVSDPNAMIICHCGGGGRSALAAENLRKMGYKNVRSMAGGLKAWKAAGLPTTS